jgi:hypothetical protein
MMVRFSPPSEFGSVVKPLAPVWPMKRSSSVSKRFLIAARSAFESGEVKVRKALEKVGVEVRTEWGSRGWTIPAADKAKLRRIMSGDVPLFPASRKKATA